MPPPFVTTQGLQIKTIEEMVNELSEDQRALISDTLDTSVEEPLGQLNGIIADHLRQVWELLQEAYHGFDRDNAEDRLLDYIGALTGTLRDGALPSTVTLSIDLDSGVTLISETHFAHVQDDPTSRWTPLADFQSPANGIHQVVFRSEFTGAIPGNANTINVIATPVTGWNSVNNSLDANIGKEIDSNAEYRRKQEEELKVTGSATLDAIRSDVISNESIFQANVIENTSDRFDPITGLPGHSIEVIIFDGDPPLLGNNEIAQLIWDTKGGGIGTYGLESGIAVDNLGTLHTVFFTRSQGIEIWVEIAISINEQTNYEGSDALKQLLIGHNVELVSGRDVISAALDAIAMGMEGIFDITVDTKIDTVNPPVATGNYIIGSRQVARLDTSRIIVVETFAPLP